MPIQPYLFFEGRCEEALDFYACALGANIDSLMRYSESPVPPPPDKLAPGSENKIMHASLRIGDAVLMASDGLCPGEAGFRGFSLSLTVADAAEADRIFASLADRGQALRPLSETFRSPRFGMVADRFGVLWMVMVPR